MTTEKVVEEPTPVQNQRPDEKTRRYDRQLRLWAASGQAALESSRVLVLSGSATSTSVLKNLVLPGIGHFTVLDARKVSPEDAGNNFFLEGNESIGKPIADETVRLLNELNESVDGQPNRKNLADVLTNEPDYLTSFSLVIAHNIDPALLERVSDALWSNPLNPPLITIRSAGFIAEFHIQFHEHTVIDSHPEEAPSLRIDKPFPALFEHAMKLDFDKMEDVDHAHVPYIVILIHVMEKWKVLHDGKPPKTSDEKKQFKKMILDMRRKQDEENFEEAEAQAYRVWTETTVPSNIRALFKDPGLQNLSPSSSPFFHLLSALKEFTEQPPHTLPLTSTLPDFASDTTSYVHMQKLYKAHADHEKGIFKGILARKGYLTDGDADRDALADEFVKNAHGLRILRGRRWGDVVNPTFVSKGLEESPRDGAVHLALTALGTYQTQNVNGTPTVEELMAICQTLVDKGVEMPEEVEEIVGEVARAPTADLPNTAAFMGGLVAQEAIKMITRQYVPVNGVCTVDLVASATGTLGV